MGPLAGVRVIEIAGIGPGPFAAMLLADLGAEVLRVDRVESVGAGWGDPTLDFLGRGRRSVAVNLKHPDGVASVLRLVERADAQLALGQMAEDEQALVIAQPPQQGGGLGSGGRHRAQVGGFFCGCFWHAGIICLLSNLASANLQPAQGGPP